MRCLELVVGALQSKRLLLVAGRAVRAGQDVEPLELIAGVADVATHGRVGPLTGSVAVEPQVQLDELGHLVDQVVAVAECAHPLAYELGADDVVMVERDRAALDEPSGLGLADVVQQRGQADDEIGRTLETAFESDRLLEHGQRVLVDVLVAMVLIALEDQRRQLGQHLRWQDRSRPAAAARPPGRRRSAAC